MKVFISWSGETSQKVAEILKHWIPCVIQSVEPYFSSADIDKGARWSTDIAKELQNASFGILCVTKENLNSAWLNFEAGALSKSIEQSRVCPFLIDLKPADIQDSPILQFQMANMVKEDVFKLFKSINRNLGDLSLNEDILVTTFDMVWPKLDEELKKISTTPESSTSTKKGVKDSQSSIEEILELVRYQHKLLKTPEELLPPGYLADILRRTNCFVPQNMVLGMSEQIHEIGMLANDALEMASRDGIDSSESMAPISEIVKRVRKLDMQLRRQNRNLELMF